MRLIQSNFIDNNYNLTLDNLKQLLEQRFNSIDFDEAKADVLSFVKDKTKLDLWNKEFFIAITENLQAE